MQQQNQHNEDKALSDLVKRGIRIPPQPQVVIEMQELLVGGKYDIRAVAKVLAKDPGIVAMLFKAAKSPIYRRDGDLTTLDQVLMVIGVKQTFNLVQAVALSTSLGHSSRKAFEIFWTRAREIAQIAALIADDRVSICNVFPEQAYMAGIFHECGVPVLMLRFKDYCKALNLEQASCWPNLAEEDARFNVDHCSVGYLVAKHWKLPDFVCAAIRYHHEMPGDNELGAAVSLFCILQLAIHFYLRMNHQENPLWAKIGAQVMAEVGLSLDDESDYLDQISAGFLSGHDND